MDVSEAQEVKTIAGRKRTAEEAGGGSQSGQRHAAIGDPKKLTGLVVRRAEVQAAESGVCDQRAARLRAPEYSAIKLPVRKSKR